MASIIRLGFLNYYEFLKLYDDMEEASKRLRLTSTRRFSAALNGVSREPFDGVVASAAVGGGQGDSWIHCRFQVWTVSMTQP